MSVMEMLQKLGQKFHRVMMGMGMRMTDNPNVGFDDSRSGIKISFGRNPPIVGEYFGKLCDKDIMAMILEFMNNCATILQNNNRPHEKF